MEGIFENDDIPLPKKKVKTEKKKRVISDERRAMLIENLKKGRLTSAKNRAKAKNAKEIIKRKKTDYIDKVIYDEVVKQEEKKKSYGDLEKELDELRKQLNKTTIRDTLKKEDLKSQIIKEVKEIKIPKSNILNGVNIPIPIPIPIEKKEEPKPIINQYSENLKNNVRTRFSNNDILQEQMNTKKNKSYGGSIKRFNYH